MQVLNLRRVLLLSGLSLLAADAYGVKPASAESVNFEFAGQSEQASVWLARQGFQLKLDAATPSRTRIALDRDGLSLETLGRAEPIIARPNLEVPQPVQLVVKWGVRRYPVDANWDVGINNEAIMVMIFFGTEKLSGGLFLPPSPYFIGFFLCNNGRRNVILTGRSYARQGRYVCVDSPSSGQEITSVLDLDKAFRSAFGSVGAPSVTGLAIEADTTQVSHDGRSSAWIRSIKIAGPSER